MDAEIGRRCDFSEIRYGQCWEDADVLLEALDIQPHHVCLSIASAGDNTLAMLARSPRRVLAIDLSQAQIACLELRVAAYRTLDHHEMLELIGVVPSARRARLYQHCRARLSRSARVFWDERPPVVARGVARSGRLERYFALFSACILPLIHPRARIDRLLYTASRAERERLYRCEWNSYRWRALAGLFFSRSLLGRLGRDPEFFRYAEGPVGAWLLGRFETALTRMQPGENPYLQWILTGDHQHARAFALREENFEAIRANLDRLQWRCCSLENALQESSDASIDRFNLSNVFEYMAPHHCHRVLRRLADVGGRGCRLAYWNLLVPRRRPEALVDRLRPLEAEARSLRDRDHGFFYRDFVLEEGLS